MANIHSMHTYGAVTAYPSNQRKFAVIRTSVHADGGMAYGSVCGDDTQMRNLPG